MLLPLSMVVCVWVSLFLFNWESERDQAEALRHYIAHEFAVKQDIHIRFRDLGLRFPDLIEAAQAQLDHRLKQDLVPFRYHLVDELPQKIKRPRNELYEVAEMVLTDDASGRISEGAVTPAEDSVTDNGSNAYITDSDNHTDTNSISTTNNTNITEILIEEEWIPEYSVDLALADEIGIWMDLIDLKATLAYALETCHTNDLPFFLTQAVYDNLLQADLQQHRDINYSKFDYSPTLNLNFIAVEELGNTSETLRQQVNESIMAVTEVVAPYVNISVGFHTIDVTKQRVPSAFLTNTTHTLNFFYLTSLAGFANKIQGVGLYHIYKDKEVVNTEQDEYGTAYTEQVRRANAPRMYNSTSFLIDSINVLRDAVSLPNIPSENFHLLVDSSMKHHTISGLVAVLTQLIDSEPFDSKKFQKVVDLVDIILTEDTHEWASHLKTVYTMYVY